MKIMSISDIAISTIENEDKIKLMILREKWKELFSDLAEISTVIDFDEKIIYIKSYDSVLKHYIFANKQKLINEIMESLEIKFEIEDIKVPIIIIIIRNRIFFFCFIKYLKNKLHITTSKAKRNNKTFYIKYISENQFIYLLSLLGKSLPQEYHNCYFLSNILYIFSSYFILNKS